MMYTRACVLATLIQIVLAYSDTNPVIAWSSHNSNALSSTARNTHTPVFFESLLGNGDICDNDAVVFVDQAGLHASDLRSLSRSSSLVRTLDEAPSSLELPYMRRSIDKPSTAVASAIADHCGSRTLSVSSGELGPHISDISAKKHVVCLEMPALEGSSESRKQLMAEYEQLLSSDLEKLSTAFPKHLVVYAGWHYASLEGRQSPEDESLQASDDGRVSPERTGFSTKAAPSEGGILKRYQLLTPGLILSLLVVFFVLVPIIFMGVSALASIQSPVRLDAPKGFNAGEKKNQ